MTLTTSNLIIGSVISFFDNDGMYRVHIVDISDLMILHDKPKAFNEWNKPKEVSHEDLINLGFEYSEDLRLYHIFKCTIDLECGQMNLHYSPFDQDKEFELPIFVHDIQNLYQAITGETLNYKKTI